jgi:hypothetical protein
VPQTEFLDGPDFLDAVADAETAHGNDINAAEYRKRARQWRSDIHDLQETRARAEHLQERLDDVRRSLAKAA